MAKAMITVAPDEKEAHCKLLMLKPSECWLIVWSADSDLEIPC